MSRSGYYDWLKGKVSERSKRDRYLAEQVKSIYEENQKTYGYPRIHAELRFRGEVCGRHRVYRLMKENHLQAKMVRKKPKSVLQGCQHQTKANKLSRDFYADRINRKWVSDITMISTARGWLHLAVVMDLCSRSIIGWAMATQPTQKIVIDALTMALWRRGKPQGVLVHSDRGSQYQADDYHKLLKLHQLDCSMSRVGNCWDNAVIESFFHTLKTELTNHKRYATTEEAKRDVFEYIEVFYNQRRRHSYLGYLSPFEYEKLKANGS